MTHATPETTRFVEIDENALPLHCPRPEQSPWNMHPRVFLPLDAHGEARCPYCGTTYRLRGGCPEGRASGR